MSIVQIAPTLGDGPDIEIVDTASPGNFQVLSLALGGINSTIKGNRQHHVTGHQNLRRLRTCFPPLNVGTQLRQLLECLVSALLGRKSLVYVSGLDAIGHEREFKVVTRTLSHSSFSSEFFCVPKLSPIFWTNLNFVGVVGHEG